MNAQAFPAPSPIILLRDAHRDEWVSFANPFDSLRADTTEDVSGVFEKLSEAVKSGLFAAGYVAYEAAYGLDQALPGRSMGDLPLAWFALFREARRLKALPPSDPIEQRPGGWASSVSESQHAAGVARVRELIAAGDTYQVNYSYRLRGECPDDPYAFFRAACGAHPPPCAAYLDTGRHVICSLSPELFFRREGSCVTSRPMKGTAPRGLTLKDDLAQASRLQHSTKDRAENLMIVDMVRNDLGRVARPGTVQVPALFEVERFPSCWQMTSTVTAETDAELPALFTALFPAASITGAPKRRTMQIIADLETAPRGVYTGAIGWVQPPGGDACFNVAIRTLVADRARGAAEYGVGGGIVWDSTAAAEWEECATKAKALTDPQPVFELLETLRWDASDGYVLIEEHLARLCDSASYFAYQVEREPIRDRLEGAAAEWRDGRDRRVRLLVDAHGRATIESAVLPPEAAQGPVPVALAAEPVDAGDRFLYHKTTHRHTYDRALASAPPGCEDVLLWNGAGEVTESCLANLAAERDGQWVTPPVRCGLLAGTQRARMLAEGRVREAVVRVDDLPRCTRILLMNSVRGEREARLVPRPHAP